ncbi:MAG: DUF1492 domain-containing protein [Clostridiales bacterium]|nr:DUF1492 domain-containing protein [Clostridiales bacterium]
MGMKAKEYLQQIKQFDTVIKQKEREINELKAMSTSLGCADYSRERVQTSHSNEAPFVTPTNQLIDLEKEIQREKAILVGKKHKIISQIQGLKNSKYVEILYMRYVDFSTYEKIAAELSYSVRYIYIIHRQALHSFEKMYLDLFDAK